jgi:hypothetical protein
MPFFCSICGEESTRICERCTKDTCSNHLCDRCHKCSDCCECEVFLEEPVHEPVRSVMQAHAAAAHPPEPEPPHPPPDPDPFPEGPEQP